MYITTLTENATRDIRFIKTIFNLSNSPLPKKSINAHSIINSKARVRYSTNLLKAKNYSCLSPGEDRFSMKVNGSSRIIEAKIREKIIEN